MLPKLPWIARAEKTIGAAERRRYDLPLAHSEGTGFLMLLIGLMTFLAVLILAASLVLGALGARWTSGLEGRATVEIPATDAKGKIMPAAERDKVARRIADYLGAQSAVRSVDILAPEEIAALVEPWLGESASQLGDTPLPGLLALEMKDPAPETLAALDARIKAIAPQARIDDHQEWLTDLLRLTRALKSAAALLVGITALATALAVAGGVQARMAEHKSDIEILHLMGAGDTYIARQFQRHAALMAMAGAAGGVVAGGLTLCAIGAVSGQTRAALLPDFALGVGETAIIASLVPVAALLAWFTARWSVLRTLARMP